MNTTKDGDVLEEVWFVLEKAIDTGDNLVIIRTLKYGLLLYFKDSVSDSLVHNCGSRFYNACSPLFMRRMKDLINVGSVNFLFHRPRVSKEVLITCV